MKQLQESIDDFLAALAGKELTGQQAQQLATALHDATVDTPEMLWVNVNFEAVADEFYNAVKCLGDEPKCSALDAWFVGTQFPSVKRKGASA